MKHATTLAALLLASPAAAQYTLSQDVSVTVPETGNTEFYHLAVPNPVPSSMALIVAFHGLYSNNHDVLLADSLDESNNWDLLTDATNAGYAVLMPKAGVPYSGMTVATWGRPEMHHHVRAAIKHVVQTHPTIDGDRIYGYGFSMGGDDVLSYAARHLDPTEPMFAAAITHSGAVSPPWSYNNGLSQGVWEALYMATDYATDELLFQQATTVDYRMAIRPRTSMAWNIMHIPVRNYYDFNGTPPDDGPTAIAHNGALTAVMAAIGHPDYIAGNTNNGEGHGYTRVLTSTILAAFTDDLELPREGTTLLGEPLDPMATDERVFHFRVTRRATPQPPRMASFEWDTNYYPPGMLQPFLPRLDLHGLERVDTIRGLTKKLGYKPKRRLQVDVTIADGSPVTLELTAYTTLPNKITANRIPLPPTEYGLNGSVLWINVASDALLEIFP